MHLNIKWYSTYIRYYEVSPDPKDPSVLPMVPPAFLVGGLTSSSAGGEAFEDDHPHVQAFVDPDFVHDANHLQGQHILAQVIS